MSFKRDRARVHNLNKVTKDLKRENRVIIPLTDDSMARRKIQETLRIHVRKGKTRDELLSWLSESKVASKYAMYFESWVDNAIKNAERENKNAHLFDRREVKLDEEER